MTKPENFKKTAVGLIPSDWGAATVGEVARITTGSRNTQDKVEDGQFPFFVRSQTVERINSFSFDGEAVLTAGDGVGTGKVFHYINGQFDCHQRVYRISDFTDRMNGFFFYKYFSASFYDRIMSMTAKSSVDSVRREMIADMAVPVPPIEEQKAIATALKDIDDLIASLDALIAKKRDIKQAAMQQLLTGKTRLPGFATTPMTNSEIGNLPSDWEVRPLGSLGDPVIGLTYRPVDVRETGTLVLRSSNVQDGVLAFDNNVFVDPEVARRALVAKGDILICVRNGSRALIGKCALISDEAEGMAFGAFMSVFRSPHSAFLFHQFQSNIIQRQIHEHLGATINQITNASLRSFRVPFPVSAEERGAIVTILSDMDAELTGLTVKLSKLNMVKEGMMQQLLTGRIRLI